MSDLKLRVVVVVLVGSSLNAADEVSFDAERPAPAGSRYHGNGDD